MSKLVLLLVLGLTVSCINTRLGDFSIVSSKNIPMTQMTVLEENVEAEDCRTRPFPFTGPPYIVPSVEDATDRAVEKVKDANALADAVVHLSAWNAILVARWCFRVRGDAVKIQ